MLRHAERQSEEVRRRERCAQFPPKALAYPIRRQPCALCKARLAMDELPFTRTRAFLAQHRDMNHEPGEIATMTQGLGRERQNQLSNEGSTGVGKASRPARPYGVARICRACDADFPEPEAEANQEVTVTHTQPRCAQPNRPACKPSISPEERVKCVWDEAVRLRQILESLESALRNGPSLPRQIRKQVERLASEQEKPEPWWPSGPAMAKDKLCKPFREAPVEESVTSRGHRLVPRQVHAGKQLGCQLAAQ